MYSQTGFKVWFPRVHARHHLKPFLKGLGQYCLSARAHSGEGGGPGGGSGGVGGDGEGGVGGGKGGSDVRTGSL